MLKIPLLDFLTYMQSYTGRIMEEFLNGYVFVGPCEMCIRIMLTPGMLMKAVNYIEMLFRSLQIQNVCLWMTT
ncbi:unnamed protein product [Camellia sinensis]